MTFAAPSYMQHDLSNLNRRVTSALIGDTAAQSPILHSIIAGYAAGICGVTVGHPMDSLKVFIQTDSRNTTMATTATNTMSAEAAGASAMSSSSSATQQRSMSTSSRVLSAPARQINLRTLYAGVAGPLVTVGLIQSANFCMYDSMRRVLHTAQHPDAASNEYLNHDSMVNVTVSSMMAGALLSFITSPLLVVKTKQQFMTWNTKTAIQDTLRRRVGQPSALPNFFIGFGPHFISESVGRGIYFGTYETLKRKFAAESGEATASLGTRVVAAGLSGITCWSIIFPLDVLRNRLTANAVLMKDDPVRSAWRLAKHMYHHEGKLRPFYRGFGVTVLRAGPVAAAVLPVYDTTLEWLNDE